jgi:hypothetical protein
MVVDRGGDSTGLDRRDDGGGGDRVIVEGRLRYGPVLGHLQRDGRWVARLANTVETAGGELVTIELRGDRAEVAERVLTAGCRLRASGRWAGRRFDIDRFDVDGEVPDRSRRYRLDDVAATGAGRVLSGPPPDRPAAGPLSGDDPPSFEPDRPATGPVDRTREETTRPSPPPRGTPRRPAPGSSSRSASRSSSRSALHERTPGADGALRI